MQQKVVIIGHSYSSRLSIVRSVAQIGCEVSVIVLTGYKRDGKTLNTRKPVDCYSKYVSHVYYCHRRDTEGLIRILLEKCTDESQRVILFPDSDDSVVTIDNHKEVLEKYFYLPYICNESGSIEYWMNKVHQKEAARSVGLNVAEGIIIDIQDGKYDIPKSIQYPCYTKPLATMNGGKGGMHRCNNENELRKALYEFIVTRTNTGKVLAEQYKEIDTEYALLGFSDGKEVIIPGIMTLLEVSKKNKGIALRGKIMPIDGFEDILERFKQLVLKIGFVGVFDIDFYRCNGNLYFCEMNLRFGGSGYAVTKMGVNLPAMFVRMCQGKDWKEANMLIQESAIYVNERMLIDDWWNGFITYRKFKNHLNSSDIKFISDANDSLPEWQFKREVCLRQIVKNMKKIFKR